MMAVSTYHRAKARRRAGAIPRRREPLALRLVRASVALPLYLAVVLYLIDPPLLAWSQVGLPAWLRWLGVVMGAAAIPMIYWVFASLGSSVSETILTKESQRLVTAGPYRWVRHPLYATACSALGALSLIAANWFMALFVVIMIGLLPALARREEAHLMAHFGAAYADYMKATGRFLPRFDRIL